MKMRFNRATIAVSGLLLGGSLFLAQVPEVHADPQASQATLQKLADAEKRYNEAMQKLEELSAKTELAHEKLAKTEQDLEETKKQITETKADIVEKEKNLLKQQSILAERVSANYKSGNVSFLSVLLDAENFNDFVTRVFYMDKISEQDAQLISEVKELKAALEKQKVSLEKRLEEEKQLLEQQKVEAQELEKSVEEARAYNESLSDEVKALQQKKEQEIRAAAEAERQAALRAAQEAARRAAERDARNGKAKVAGSKHFTPAKPSPDVVNNAMQYLGTPYLWGGTGPRFDCSGLTQHAYRLAGKSIPRTSGAQYAAVRSAGHLTLNINQLNPGDLVFFGSPVHHVGIYVGGGRYVHSPQTGDVVKVSSIGRSFVGGGGL